MVGKDLANIYVSALFSKAKKMLPQLERFPGNKLFQRPYMRVCKGARHACRLLATNLLNLGWVPVFLRSACFHTSFQLGPHVGSFPQ